jgi:hypothetical protein
MIDTYKGASGEYLEDVDFPFKRIVSSQAKPKNFFDYANTHNKLVLQYGLDSDVLSLTAGGASSNTSHEPMILPDIWEQDDATDMDTSD